MGPKPVEDEDALIDQYLERRRQAVVDPIPEVHKRAERRERARRLELYGSLTILALLLASVYVFWVLPYQLGPRPVRVVFESRK